MNTHFIPSRRSVLLGSGALVVSFSLAHSLGGASEQDAWVAKSVAKDEVDAFLAIDAKGTVTVYSGKVDLGTGVPTALAQMVAEELDVPLAAIDMVTGDTALTPDQGTTSGDPKRRRADSPGRRHREEYAADRSRSAARGWQRRPDRR